MKPAEVVLGHIKGSTVSWAVRKLGEPGPLGRPWRLKIEIKFKEG